MRHLVPALATAAALAFSTQAYGQATLTPNQCFDGNPATLCTAGPDSGGHVYSATEAAFFTVSDDPSDGIGSGPITASFGHSGAAAGTFTDHYLFTILDNGTGSGSVTTTVSLGGIGGVSDTDILSVLINGVAAVHTINTPTIDQWAADSVPIIFGNLNDIAITFLSRGNGHYGGEASFVPNGVPEPATWAMMLLGFGAVGFSMRRRKVALAQLA